MCSDVPWTAERARGTGGYLHANTSAQHSSLGMTFSYIICCLLLCIVCWCCWPRCSCTARGVWLRFCVLVPLPLRASCFGVVFVCNADVLCCCVLVCTSPTAGVLLWGLCLCETRAFCVAVSLCVPLPLRAFCFGGWLCLCATRAFCVVVSVCVPLRACCCGGCALTPVMVTLAGCMCCTATSGWLPRTI